MKRILFLLFALLFSLSSCAPRLQTTIAPPQGPRVVFVEPAKPFILGGLSEEDVMMAMNGQCAIANRGSIRFYAKGCAHAWIWLETKGDRDPDFCLIPGQIQEVIAPIGTLKAYAELEYQDTYGWHPFGVANQETQVIPFSDWGWRMYFSPSNFSGVTNLYQ